jgi:hypothetical protein
MSKLKNYAFTMKHDAFRTFLVQTTQDERHAWGLAKEKMENHDWSNEDFDTEIIAFKEMNPNGEF